jgi:hypothetical protein
MTDQENLGRFGHHPDPATDFEVEVDALQGMAYDVGVGLQNAATLRERVARAMEFRVGGVPSCVAAKGVLREIEAQLPAGA